MGKSLLNNKGQRLGRGLEAVLKSNDIRAISDEGANKIVGNIVDLSLNSIEVNPFQPRTVFNEEALQELATSIRELGLIQPITVRRIDGDKYQIVSGERRFRASKLLGLETIPAYVRLANDEESLLMALVENINRQDLDPIEIALSYQRMIDELNLTQEKMSERVGKKRSTITNYLRLLKLSPIIQTGIRDGFLTMGHGRAIINIEDQDEQLEIYHKIITQNLSVRDTEKLVQKIKNPSKEINETTSSSEKTELSQQMKENVEYLKFLFNANVSVKISPSGKGKIEIPFKSEEDFKRIQNILQSE